MTWYAAHLIMYVKLKAGEQKRFTVWENVVLLRAASDEEALAKAERRAREDEGDDDGSFRWGGHPATWVFAGVRKLVTCADPDVRPDDGMEITYIEMELPSLNSVRRLAQGHEVTVRLSDESYSEEEAELPEPEPSAAQ